ncbi:PfkB family carbohydrate kinase [Pelomonas sp. APW6]|uniref:PfkB family carbohydrate kinase n=1 Tax=Roseateles subflavus TaxID=3053353 RepID=A0ABT7LMV2_9BURK|nr:PfkB family carbohydrate kinase [Pelomonas sp. APW6]MDL5033804.1 PfkB family carbohydrate kinase [Pelomonas sp. APW6]
MRAEPQVLVVGDCMLDLYLEGAVQRISPEAPVPVLRMQRRSPRAGGASNVALNLASLGCPCSLASSLGEDAAGFCLEQLLDHPHIKRHWVRSPLFPTTQKIRLVSQRQQLLRMDIEQPVPAPVAEALMSLVRPLLPRHRYLLLSDYGKGTLHESAQLLLDARRAGCRTLVDPKNPDLGAYRGAWLLKPNLAELQAALGDWADEAALRRRVDALLASLEIEHLLVTRGAEGMTLYCRGGAVLQVPAETREVYDVSGAGDTALAALACFLVRGAGLEQAVRMANRAAGIVVGKFGTARLSLAELGIFEDDLA